MIINKFKSLYTNIDPQDVKLEYLAKAENLRLREKATETNFYSFTAKSPGAISTQNGLSIAPMITEILLYEPIELDNDHLQSAEINGKIVPTYIYNSEKKYLLVANDTRGTTRFYLNGAELNNPVGGLYHSAKVYQDRGFVLILLDTETLWLGKLNRKVWEMPNVPIGYYLDRYLEPYNTTRAKRINITTTVEVNTTQTDTLEDVYVDFTHKNGGIRINAKDKNQNLGYEGNPNLPSDAYVHIYTCKETVSGNVVNSLDTPPKTVHAFLEPYELPDWILIPTNYFEGDGAKFKIFLGNQEFPAYLNWTKVTNPHIVIRGTDRLSGTYFQIPKTTLSNPTGGIKYAYAKSIGTYGFENSDKNYEIVVTAILDYKEEVVINYIKGDVGIINVPKYALKFTNVIPSNCNSRVTGMGFYIRFNEKTDFTEVKSFNFISSERQLNFSSFNIGEIDANGIQLVQRIGTLFNPNTYQLIDSFDYFQRIDGLAYAVKNNQVYGSIAGSGKVLDLFYAENYIPSITNEKIVYMSNMNNIPAIHDVKKTVLLVAENSGFGQIYYRIRDIVGFAIKDRYDIAVSPDGIAIHTKEGIYIYNGSQLQLISKEINDIIEANFEDAGIFFDNVNKDLFYITSKENVAQLYRYSFIEKAWTTHTIPIIHISELKNVSIDHNNNLLLVTKTNYYESSKTRSGRAVLKTQSTNFGKPKEYKVVNEIQIDFKGIIEYKGNEYKSAIIPGSTTLRRSNTVIPNKLINRKPNREFEFEFTLIDDTELYSVNIIEESVAEIDT